MCEKTIACRRIEITQSRAHRIELALGAFGRIDERRRGACASWLGKFDLARDAKSLLHQRHRFGCIRIQALAEISACRSESNRAPGGRSRRASDLPRAEAQPNITAASRKRTQRADAALSAEHALRADHASRRTQTEHATQRRGKSDGTERVTADRKRHQPGGDSGGAAAR